MGNNNSYQKINFEDLQYGLNKSNYIIINTLKENEQNCLISGTTPVGEEETIINHILNNMVNKNIIIYGKNSCDDLIYKKYEQLKKLGIVNVYLYCGGLFEWLLLQDIYGCELFPTTSVEKDLLRFKGSNIINLKFIEN